MTRRYAVLDVFADQPLAGNPLAVVLDAQDLDDRRMQAIAAEFNLSETVFVQSPDNPAHTAALRIFTPGKELPFAGHPTIGTAVLLGLEADGASHNRRDQMLVLEQKIGSVRCGVVLRGEQSGHAVFDLPQLPVAIASAANRDEIALALGLLPVEIGFENHEPSSFDAGVPYSFVPVRDLETIGRARPHQQHFDRPFGDGMVQSVFVYTRETVGSAHHFHARMFAPAFGIAEDPATGSAVAAFAGAVARFDQPAGGSHHYTVEQGFEMGRPSLIGLEIDMDDGTIQSARISGDAVVVARGTLSI